MWILLLQYSVHDGSKTGLEMKAQIPRWHFSVSYLQVIGAQDLSHELIDISISASTPPVGILQIYHKNKQPGDFGRSSLPCPGKSSDSAHWGSHLWPCSSWILPGIPTCSRNCRGQSLLCPWHYCSSPFPLSLLAPFPLGTALPIPVGSREHSFVDIFFSL